MAPSTDTVRAIYAAFASGDVPGVLGAFDPQIEWWEAEGFLYADGNPYTGPQAVAEGVFNESDPTSRTSPFGQNTTLRRATRSLWRVVIRDR